MRDGKVYEMMGDEDGYDAAPIQAATAALAGVCDWAQSQDGQGYNGTDTHLGHLLAALPADLWDADTALAAWDMTRKYKGQLAGFGIEWDDIAPPPGADEIEADRREARARARESAKAWRRAAQFKQNSYVACEGPGEQVVLAFAGYDPDLVDAARRIPGRRYNGARKVNEFPFTSLAAVIALADQRGIEVPPEVRALLASQPQAPAADVVGAQDERPAETVEPTPAAPEMYLEGGRVIVSTPAPRWALIAELRQLNKGRTTWDYEARRHRLPKSTGLHVAADIAERHSLSVSPEIRDILAAHELNQTESGAITSDPVDIPGLAADKALKPQQFPVVRYALRNRRVVIGDDMGWGKTLSSLATVAADAAFPVIIVCRPSLVLNWQKEIAQFFPSWDVHICTGTTAVPILPGPQAVIIGTAALGTSKTVPGGDGEKNAKVFPWVAVLGDLEARALIIDEGQDAKEHTANRSQAIKELADPARELGGLVLDLTGTAIVNRVRELAHQLDILGWLDAFGGRTAFLRAYRDEASHLDLHRRLCSWGIMVRRSDDSALGLPELRHHVLPLDPAALPADVMARYRQAEDDVIAFLAEEAAKIAASLGADPDDARVRAAMAARAAEHLVLLNTLRKLIGEAKIPAATAWVQAQVDTREKVMIAAHHQQVTGALAARFGGLTITGGQPAASKEEDKARFQGEPVTTAPVITVSITAGGVGHTLTAARIGVQVEYPWTPGDFAQMAKRLHRIGQDRDVDYYRMLVTGTVDEHMDRVIARKQGTLDAVLDGKGAGKREAASESAAAAEVAWAYAQQGLARTQAAT